MCSHGRSRAGVRPKLDDVEPLPVGQARPAWMRAGVRSRASERRRGFTLRGALRPAARLGLRLGRPHERAREHVPHLRRQRVDVQA